MNTLDFSVILVNWNTADLTCRAIDSVLEDANHSNLATEVLVVDNGSTEGSVEAIRANHPGIEILENTLNLGFARAVNRAVWKATGEFILLLNTDAILRPGALAAFKSAFDGDPQIGIAGGALISPDGSKQNCVAPFPSLATELINKSLLRSFSKRHRSKVPDGVTEPFEVDSVIGASLAIRGKTLAAIGGLDERFFFFFEETDWCYQCRKLGWKVVCVPQAVVEHGQGESSKPVLVDTRVEFYRSRYRYFQKTMGNSRPRSSSKAC
ncbi:MAG: glycosyltransferase family 2 protein [Candidatus Omnitrophica bacterium]|nr:glycosyltransferase family 2 protein [Candidatus Omnitrophota bacterium]